MKKTFSLILLSFTLKAAALPVQINELSDLQKLRQRDLNALYGEIDAGTIPNGGSRGKAIVLPGTLLTYPAAAAMGLVWQGKIFEKENSEESTVLFNRVFGFKAIQAKVFYGPSWYDGQESIIVDYLETSLLVPFVRDEIREIAPGLYLGRAYARTLIGPQFALNFALDFR